MSELAVPAVFSAPARLTMDSAESVREEGRRLLAAGPLVVDLSALTQLDSAALALILDWLRCAREHGHALQLRGAPAALRSLATLYEIDDLLPFVPLSSATAR